jgi:hypothetical protein
MLTERIIGTLTFRRGIYAEVEADKTFTATAWTLVVIFAFLNQLGAHASQSIFGWLVSTGICTLTAIADRYLLDSLGGGLVCGRA